MQKEAIYAEKREVRAFVELNHASNILIQTTDEHLRGNFYTVMGSLLRRAFTFEAYLNHLGEKQLNLWSPNQQISVWTKFDRICANTKYSCDRSVRPFLTLRELFEFRNAIAHGRSETLEECYGYRNIRVEAGVRLEIDEGEARVVRRIFEMASGGCSLKKIAKTLNSEKIAPPRPRANKAAATWCPTAIHAMLRREMYVGRVIWNRSRFVNYMGKLNQPNHGKSSSKALEAA